MDGSERLWCTPRLYVLDVGIHNRVLGHTLNMLEEECTPWGLMENDSWMPWGVVRIESDLLAASMVDQERSSEMPSGVVQTGGGWLADWAVEGRV